MDEHTYNISILMENVHVMDTPDGYYYLEKNNPLQAIEQLFRAGQAASVIMHLPLVEHCEPAHRTFLGMLYGYTHYNAFAIEEEWPNGSTDENYIAGYEAATTTINQFMSKYIDPSL